VYENFIFRELKTSNWRIDSLVKIINGFYELPFVEFRLGVAMMVCIRTIARKFTFKSKVGSKMANLGLVASCMQVVFRELLITICRFHIYQSCA